MKTPNVCGRVLLMAYSLKNEAYFGAYRTTDKDDFLWFVQGINFMNASGGKFTEKDIDDHKFGRGHYVCYFEMDFNKKFPSCVTIDLGKYKNSKACYRAILKKLPNLPVSVNPHVPFDKFYKWMNTHLLETGKISVLKELGLHDTNDSYTSQNYSYLIHNINKWDEKAQKELFSAETINKLYVNELHKDLSSNSPNEDTLDLILGLENRVESIKNEFKELSKKKLSPKHLPVLLN